tara:strand:- start:3783 stop:4976 length:1194 start_codon:yes stop_codon:yes gene_type:complete
MANNALIQGAARTDKKFLDAGNIVGKSFSQYDSSLAKQAEDTAAKNKAINNNVNSLMDKMKTDVDFTSFSLEETKTMRDFLMSQRKNYTDAAKEAAKFDDRSNPEYLQYIDIMQGVNNSVKNMASQIGAYKKGKVDYAENQLEGRYSNGNGDANRIAAIAYGFANIDKDNKADPGINAPFKILPGGNLGFDIDGAEISYNNMEQPFLRDAKLGTKLQDDITLAFSKGQQGGELNKYILEGYKTDLEDMLSNPSALKSIIYDFESSFNTKSVAKRLDEGTINLEEAREEVVNLFVNARKDVFNEGKKEYDIKQNKAAGKFSSSEIQQLKEVNDKIKLLDSESSMVKSMGGSNSRYAIKIGESYYETDRLGGPLDDKKPLSKAQVVELLNLNVRGLNWK